MRLTTSKETYEFDFKFYLISGAILAVILGGFYTAKRMRDYYEGREVQKVLNTAALGTPEAHRPAARAWATNFKRQYNLDDKQTKEAEEIMVNAFYRRILIWTEGRKQSRNMDEVRREMQAELDAGSAKVRALVGK